MDYKHRSTEEQIKAVIESAYLLNMEPLTEMLLVAKNVWRFNDYWDAISEVRRCFWCENASEKENHFVINHESDCMVLRVNSFMEKMGWDYE